LRLQETERAVLTIGAAESMDALEQIRQLFREYQALLQIDLCFQDFEAELAALPGKYALPEGALLLARVDGQAAGCVALRRIDTDVCEMKRLFVREGYRGLGLGRALVERIIIEARGRGYRMMRLDTLSRMEDALRLYASFGFVPTAPYIYNPIEDVRYLELAL
jgi:putative acetyltransferase